VQIIAALCREFAPDGVKLFNDRVNLHITSPTVLRVCRCGEP
jgi:hypothetical protein